MQAALLVFYYFSPSPDLRLSSMVDLLLTRRIFTCSEDSVSSPSAVGPWKSPDGAREDEPPCGVPLGSSGIVFAVAGAR